MNSYYVDGRERAANVERLFNRIAPRYDLINDLQSFGLHRLWKRRLVRLASATPGDLALDLCCGTGDVAFALRRHGLRAVGVDFSRNMLAVALARAAAPAASEGCVEVSGCDFLAGDATRLPFADSTFGVATVSYGLRNLASWRDGLREMHRVVRPGGLVLVLDFGKPEAAWLRRLYFLYLRWFVPILGKVFCGDRDAYGYILESLERYPAQRGVAAEMERLGFRQSRVIELLAGIMSINVGVK